MKSFSQVNPASLNSIIPPSPNAASLGRFGDVPVGKYTGVANISIPLYNVSLDGLELPISLSYHSGGIKVEDEASWVGLNWALQAGGVISRTMRSLNDFHPDHGFLKSPDMPDRVCDPENPYRNGFCEYVGGVEAYSDLHGCDLLVNGVVKDFQTLNHLNLDWEPDVFHFNFLNYSGQFVFDRKYNENKLIHFSEKTPLKIETVDDNDQPITLVNPSLVIWLITDNSGFKYYFKAREYVGYGESTVSSWYLSKIVSPSNKKIDFTYGTEAQPVQKTYHVQVYSGNLPQVDYTDISQTFSQLYLEKISFENGYIIFDRGQQGPAGFGTREDLQYARRLEEVRIYGDNAQPLKKYSLQYSYYNASSLIEFKRLRLDEVVESIGGETHKWSLKYNSLALPSKFSFAQDHWGFYNGMNNSILVPAYAGWVKVGRAPDLDLVWGEFTGANRSVDPTYSGAGLIESIQYPTGGKTDFVFESNRYDATLRVGDDLDDYTYDPYQAIGIHYAPPTNGVPPSTDENVNSATFTIKEADPLFTKNILIEMSLNFNGNTGGLLAAIKLKMINNATGLVDYTMPPPVLSSNDQPNYRYSEPIRLNSGSYHFEVEFEPGARPCTAIISTKIRRLKSPAYTKNKPAGGVRIKRITSSDGMNNANSQVKEYVYDNPVNIDGIDVAVSDGKALIKPDYGRQNHTFGGETIVTPELTITTLWTDYSFERHATSKVSLGGGSSVGYSKVSELHGAQGTNGKIMEYFFIQSDINVNIPYKSRPVGLPTDLNPMNGKLLKQEIYDKTRLIKSIENSYSVVDMQRLPAMAVENHQTFIGGAACAYSMYFYPITSQWSQLLSKTETDYSGSSSLVSITNYEYTPNQELRLVKTTNSKGEIHEVHSLYPTDFAAPAATSGTAYGIKMLQDKNINSAVIESYTLFKRPSDITPALIAGQATKYIQNSNNLNQVVPSQVLVLETQLPITTYIAPTIAGTNLNFPSYYVPRINFDKYDDQGNIAQRGRIGDVKESYLWGYGKKYPIAQVVGGDYDKVAYTSFESGIDEGNWVFSVVGISNSSIAKTGFYFKALTPTVTMSSKILPIGKYSLEYYAKSPIVISGTGITVTNVSNSLADANGWILYKKEITLPTSNSLVLSAGSGSIQIDEVRLYPLGALMTTYTYKPLVGVTSMTDANSITTYYEYENGRLTFIKDDKKNILKKTDYNFKVN